MAKTSKTALISPFKYSDYKGCLRDALNTSGVGRGRRAQLARFLGCQPAFVSQLVNRPTHISLEHAYGVCQFLQFDAQETEYFLALVQHARAGTSALRSHYERQLAGLLRSRDQIKSRLALTAEISGEQRAVYYSSWHYAAIHVMTSVATLQSPAAIATYLGLPLASVKEHLRFLVAAGLVAEAAGKYQATARRIHLDNDSPLITKHHTNWRLRAIFALDRQDPDRLHFSATLAIAVADARRIKEILLKAIADQEAIMAPSKEEAVFALGIDFYRL